MTPRPSTSRLALAWAFVRLARPRQWIKNTLVFAAPVAAGVLLESGPLARTLVAFVALCLVASGTYYINDALDVESDREHPTKQHRPVAAGVVSPRFAIGGGIFLLILGLAVSLPVNNGELTLVIASYVIITVAYSLYLKNEPVIELGIIATCFVLRTVAGGVAAEVTISNWFLIVAASGALFVIAGKRHAELLELDDKHSPHRRALDEYTTGFLAFVRAISGAVLVTAYCLWAFESAANTGDYTWFRISIVPFVLAVMRYAHIIELGRGGAPEDVVLEDHTLQVLALIWIATFILGTYA